MSRRRKRIPDTVFETTVEDLSHDGRGVTHEDGKAVFIHGALPGERVRYRLAARRRKFDIADVVEVLEPSEERVEARCAHFGVCGGCVLQHQNPPAQIDAKQSILMENLRRIGGVTPGKVLPPLQAEAWGYRRKARLSVRHVFKKEKVLVGFRERNGRYVADLERCHVLIEAVGFRLEALSELLYGLEGRDRIPQIEVAAGDEATVLVFRHLDPLSESDLEALKRFEAGSELVIYLQPGNEDTIHPLTDPVDLYYTVENFRMNFEPGDFIQVNTDLNQLMVAQALDLLDLNDDDRVLDLFCGLGNFSLPMARRAGEVVGVEGELKLVNKARANAGFNGVENAQFHVADLREDPSGTPWARQAFSKLLLDPPRSGAEEILPTIGKLDPETIVYVSCHPGSLARDAGILVNQHGYALRAAGVMDMFPHTAHVESMALFKKP